MITMTELEQDALAESFNLSLGRAAAVFADIVSEEIQLSVPSVEILPRELLIQRLVDLTGADAGRRLCCITQRYRAQEDFETDTLLLFPELGSMEIVRRMLGDTSVDIGQITELEQDALGEIGNIIINNCMAGLADIFGSEVVGTLPGVRAIHPHQLLDGQSDSDVILVARIGMSMLQNNIFGYVLFIMNVPSLEAFMKQVRRFFQLPERSEQ
jgi:chemotaxis protein CheC